jgi:hypothetical protein
MTRVLFVLALVIGGGAAACADPAILSLREYQPIAQYYSDCNYIAQNGTLAKVEDMIAQIRGNQRPRFGLFSFRDRGLYRALQGTYGTLLQPDPGMCRFLRPSLAYVFRTTVQDVLLRDGATLRLRVVRAQVLRPKGPFFSTGPAWPLSEIDEWVKLSGRWRLRAAHYVLL